MRAITPGGFDLGDAVPTYRNRTESTQRHSAHGMYHKLAREPRRGRTADAEPRKPRHRETHQCHLILVCCTSKQSTLKPQPCSQAWMNTDVPRRAHDRRMDTDQIAARELKGRKDFSLSASIR